LTPIESAVLIADSSTSHTATARLVENAVKVLVEWFHISDTRVPKLVSVLVEWSHMSETKVPKLVSVRVV
jgi:hypothetical protein